MFKINKNQKPIDSNGKKHGYWETYWGNGKLQLEGYFIHGNKYGYFKTYYSDGELIENKFYYGDKKFYCTSKNKILS